ncbi:flagellar hook-basal body protein [Sporosarcina siberiensis]|uniref:Flagellar hook-basal body protein n=1 Tax=Sporosarcina siberiensis TaxID=1365606 RepID=A0ABW4SLH4_9BACL
MLRTMVTATNTLNQLQHKLDLIGNNLANTNTHGFKSSNASFQELLYQQFNNDKADEAPRQSPLGIRYGVGAALGQASMNSKVGTLQITNRDLDFALTKQRQYFNVLMPTEAGEKVAYTRQGAFYVSPIDNGQLMLVTSEGYPVANAAGQPITFADDVQSYFIQSNGTLGLKLNDGTTAEIELGVTVIERPNLMEHLSGTYSVLPSNLAELGVIENDAITNLQGAARSGIGMENNALESSNVDMQKEMTDLITVQRNYQFNSRAITLADQMMGLINGIR